MTAESQSDLAHLACAPDVLFHSDILWTAGSSAMAALTCSVERSDISLGIRVIARPLRWVYGWRERVARQTWASELRGASRRFTLQR